jgi:hypothetical protein
VIARGSEATQSGVRAATSGGAARKGRLLLYQTQHAALHRHGDGGGSIVDAELGKDVESEYLDLPRTEERSTGRPISFDATEGPAVILTGFALR